MRDDNNMDSLTSSHFVSILESHDFSTLLRAIDQTASALLGEACADEPVLLLSEDGGQTGWVVSLQSVRKRSLARPVPLRGDWLRRVGSAPAPLLFQESPAQLIGCPELAEAARPGLRALALPLGGDPGGFSGALLLSLASIVTENEPLLRLLASDVSRVVPRLLHQERTEAQNRQMLHLHEGLLKALVAPNMSSLLASLLVVMNRQFGFSRIIIAQVNPETQTLRSEMHSGFGSGFTPLAAPLDQERHPFIQAMTRGDALIFDRDDEATLEHLPDFLRAEPAARRAILPLMIGMRPVGLIYADQSARDGIPWFRPVFEIFARMAAAALEGLSLRLRAELRAETDALTGLYNRHFLNKILEIEIPRVKRYNHSISLLMLDLCDFKYFNDAYGHQFGDYILRETASLLQANVRRPDIVVRYGGDEFVVLMVNTTNEQALLVKNRIERAFIERNRMQTDERSVIKISIGLRSADAATIENLLHEADMEMYAHKAHQTRLLLIEALLSGNIEKIEAADRIVGSLCNILYKKAPYYPEHARRVAHLALIIARRAGVSDSEAETLALGALLHDVGKVSIPTEILQKTEPLTSSEMAAMRHHPALGEEFFHGLDHLEPVRPIIRSHHERFDGQVSGDFPGYPDGLCGERIPLPARMLKLAESAECMLYGGHYQPGRTPEEVLRLLRDESGKSFDPRLVAALLGDKAWMQDLGEVDCIRQLLNLED